MSAKNYPDFSELVGSLFLTRHNAIYDPGFQKHLAEAPWEQWLSQVPFLKVKEEYIEKFVDWIYSSRQNRLSESLKLERGRYKKRDIIVGTTQAFDEAYFRYHDRRLRVFRGEYGYHKRCFKNTTYLDNNQKQREEALGNKDWVIVSHPFCGTGDRHPLLNEIREECLSKKIPLLLDCAWFGTCFDMDFDWDHPAITELCLSLTKGIGLGYMRTGLRFSNYSESENMPIAQQNSYEHLVFSNCQLGIHQMEKFSPDFQAEKYKNWYLQLCKKYDLISTKCLHIALLNMAQHQATHFLIDEVYSKVGLREALKAIRQKRLLL